jgi:uncharacterized membrane protein
VAMSSIVHTIDVDVPVRTAYDQWTQFEDFPKFMEGVERVTQIDDARLEWTAEVLGQQRTWRAEITEQVPDQRVAWRSMAGEGVEHAGIVTFEPLTDDRTRVTLNMTVEPQGPAEKVGDAAGLIERKVEGDLARYKEFIERRGTPTGAWRGTIDRPKTD